jgi:hypothetical protein
MIWSYSFFFVCVVDQMVFACVTSSFRVYITKDGVVVVVAAALMRSMFAHVVIFIWSYRIFFKGFFQENVKVYMKDPTYYLTTQMPNSWA